MGYRKHLLQKVAKINFVSSFKLSKKIDIFQSKRPDYIISNSLFVKKWIAKKTYNLDSHVIYPSVDTQLFKLQKIQIILLQRQDWNLIKG